MMEPTTEIAAYNTKLEADLVVAVLAEAGIDAFIVADNLGGTFNGDLTIVLDTTTGNGDVQAFIDWNSGSQLGNIPVAQREMALTIAGLKFAPPSGPEGYEWQIDGSCFLPEPTAVENTSWGNLKTMGGGN